MKSVSNTSTYSCLCENEPVSMFGVYPVCVCSVVTLCVCMCCAVLVVPLSEKRPIFFFPGTGNTLLSPKSAHGTAFCS